VIWYIDGREIKRITGPQVGRQEMNIVLYLVSGSGWAPTPDVAANIYPLQFEIDYIKGYQRGNFIGNGVYPVVAPEVVEPEVVEPEVVEPVVVEPVVVEPVVVDPVIVEPEIVEPEAPALTGTEI